MERIASFNIDHTKLTEGVYVSRRDIFNDQTVTTLDIRMKVPNQGSYLSTAQAHTVEHLGATFFRNHRDYKDITVYFGPMGCRTGFYWLIGKDCEAKEMFPAVLEMFEFIVGYEGSVPGASAAECGNYRDLELESAQAAAREFLQKAAYFTDENFVYLIRIKETL